MNKRKKEFPAIPFDEALARLLQTDPKELKEEFAADILQKRQATEKRIADVRKELKDGARPRKGRFRL